MDPDQTSRRRSPQWVRELTDREVHGIAFNLRNTQAQEDLSDAQEWLWDALMSELQWRRRHTDWPHHRCSCELCFEPFPDPSAT
jgi:hypothetical protein